MDPDLDALEDRRYGEVVAALPSTGSRELRHRHGLHVTAQRLAVLGAVAERPHSSADEIIDTVRAAIGAVSRQAVYDTLGIFCDRGLLRRIQPAGSPARYRGASTTTTTTSSAGPATT